MRSGGGAQLASVGEPPPCLFHEPLLRGTGTSVHGILGGPLLGKGLRGPEGPGWSEGNSQAALGCFHSWSLSSRGSGVTSQIPLASSNTSIFAGIVSAFPLDKGGPQVHCLFLTCTTTAAWSLPPRQPATGQDMEGCSGEVAGGGGAVPAL